MGEELILNTDKINGVEEVRMGNSTLYIKVPTQVEGFTPVKHG